MPTKNQAKNAIDAMVVLVKNEIDNIAPAGINIKDGDISFSPNHGNIIYDAGGILATATAWRDAILLNLTNAGRNPVLVRNGLGRRGDDSFKSIEIQTALFNHTITNF